MFRMRHFVLAFAIPTVLAAQAHAALIPITGNVSGALENVLFNEAGLIGSGLTVTCITNQSDLLVSFTEDSETLTTPSAGQARVSASSGLFDSVLFQSLDSRLVFLLFEANVNVTGEPTLRITATGSETLTFDLPAGNGENRFGIVAQNSSDFISSVLIQSLGADAISDVRQVRVGGLGLPGGSVTPIGLVSAPEPGALILFGTGLLGVAVWTVRRRMP